MDLPLLFQLFREKLGLAVSLVSFFKDKFFFSYIQYYCLPGERKRLLKDFAIMLTILLEGGVSEQQAVVLAAEATNNEIFLKKASEASTLLAEGIPMPDVLETKFDPEGEFAWRYRNCNLTGDDNKLSDSIANWCQWLEASAFRSEQVFAQTFSSLLMLVAAVPIFVIAYVLFNIIIILVDAIVIW